MHCTIIHKLGRIRQSGAAAVVFFLFSLLLFPGQGFLSAAPARRHAVTLRQPDGYTFRASLSGDEYIKVLLSSEGTPLVQDEEGYYCYAYYGTGGGLFSTGYRVGQSAPAAASLRGAAVPYDMLLEKASLSSASRGRRDRKGLIERLRFSGRSSSGDGQPVTVKVAVLLVAFKNLPFTYTRDDFDKLLNQRGYSLNGATGSAADYFEDQFFGRYLFQFDVSEIVTLGNNYGYYGRNENMNSAGSDIRVGRMVYDACLKADDLVDFSMYDNDGDGQADNVIIIFAGGDEAAGAGADHIWSRSGFLDEDNLVLECDGVGISSYACTSERRSDGLGDDPVASIGTFCHEFSHVLGLPDFYDRNGISDALWGSTSIMDKGNLNNDGNTPPSYNAIERHILGISSPDTLSSGQYVLPPVGESGEYLYYPTENEGEYFLFECRRKSGWDSHIGGEGMLIYHVDSSANNVAGARACERWLMTGGTYANTVNSVPDHQCADLIEADPSARSSGASSTAQDDISRVFFPYGSQDSFTPATEPAFEDWNGNQAGISIAGIKYEDGRIFFSVYENEYSQIPYVQSMSITEFQDAAIVTWTAGTDIPAHVVLSGSDGPVDTLEVEAYAFGRYSAVFEGLSPASTYTVSVGYAIGGLTGRVSIRQISTHPATSYPPYIYLHGMTRNTDGSFPAGTPFPLRLYNACGAESVRWTYDGEEVFPDETGYFVPDHTGVMRAVAVFPDGREYRVSKHIEIKSE